MPYCSRLFSPHFCLSIAKKTLPSSSLLCRALCPLSWHQLLQVLCDITSTSFCHPIICRNDSWWCICFWERKRESEGVLLNSQHLFTQANLVNKTARFLSAQLSSCHTALVHSHPPRIRPHLSAESCRQVRRQLYSTLICFFLLYATKSRMWSQEHGTPNWWKYRRGSDGGGGPQWVLILLFIILVWLLLCWMDISTLGSLPLMQNWKDYLVHQLEGVTNFQEVQMEMKGSRTRHWRSELLLDKRLPDGSIHWLGSKTTLRRSDGRLFPFNDFDQHKQNTVLWEESCRHSTSRSSTEIQWVVISKLIIHWRFCFTKILYSTTPIHTT